jgi:hypothetical protein
MGCSGSIRRDLAILQSHLTRHVFTGKPGLLTDQSQLLTDLTGGWLSRHVAKLFTHVAKLLARQSKLFTYQPELWRYESRILADQSQDVADQSRTRRIRWYVASVFS